MTSHRICLALLKADECRAWSELSSFCIKERGRNDDTRLDWETFINSGKSGADGQTFGLQPNLSQARAGRPLQLSAAAASAVTRATANNTANTTLPEKQPFLGSLRPFRHGRNRPRRLLPGPIMIRFILNPEDRMPLH